MDKKSWKSAWSKPVDNLEYHYHQAGASDANTSWYRLEDSQATYLQLTCCNLRVSGCFLFNHFLGTRVKTHKLLQVCKQVVTASCVHTACSQFVVTSLEQAVNNLLHYHAITLALSDTLQGCSNMVVLIQSWRNKIVARLTTQCCSNIAVSWL